MPGKRKYNRKANLGHHAMKKHRPHVESDMISEDASVTQETSASTSEAGPYACPWYSASRESLSTFYGSEMSSTCDLSSAAQSRAPSPSPSRPTASGDTDIVCDVLDDFDLGRDLPIDGLNRQYDDWTDDEESPVCEEEAYHIPHTPPADEIDEATPPYRDPAKEYAFASSVDDVQRALTDLTLFLKPPRKPKKAYGEIDVSKDTKEALVQMKYFFQRYVELKTDAPSQPGAWTRASQSIAKVDTKGSKGTYLAKQLRARGCAYITDRKVPHFKTSAGRRSCMDDEDTTQLIAVYLLTKGEFFTAQDIVDFCSTPAMLERMDRSTPISLEMAQDWLKRHDYRFAPEPRGQYADGHENPPQVRYRNKVYCPAIKALLPCMRTWDNATAELRDPVLKPGEKIVVLWYHNESTFYAHDHRKMRWVHKKAKLKPWVKGEGVSLMVADFVSLDHGWLQSPDGKEDARVYFRAGKNKDGYFDNTGILKQFHSAVNILQKHYPDEEHVMIYDNAPTHLKRPEGSLSARSMPKKASKKFFVQTTKLDNDERPVYGPDGKLVKEKVVRMTNTTWEGKPQKLYYDENPGRNASEEEKELAGYFVGMRRLLEERGLYRDRMKTQCGKKWADCPEDGKEGKVNCCCRRTLFNQPDFVNVPSILEIMAKNRGVRVLFLPKFHCELNPIEMCWAYAKRIYRTLPFSKRADVLEKNVRKCLDDIPLVTQRRFVNRCLRFTDAYSRGLDGAAAAWAVKKYRSHRSVPENIMALFDEDQAKKATK